MSYAKRVDANSAEIQRALRQCGVYVKSLQRQGDSVLDLLCCRCGTVALLEVKTKSGHPSKGQKQFIEEWRAAGGRAEVVKTIDQALRVFGVKIPA